MRVDEKVAADKKKAEALVCSPVETGKNGNARDLLPLANMILISN